MSSLLALPEDILLEICRYIHPLDLLSLKQTCRALYAFGCTDYVWHQLHVDLPLNLSPYHDATTLSAPHLQQLLTRALRLDHNWRKQWTQTKHTTKIIHGDILSHMQLLDCSKWLFTMARSQRSNAHISLWSLHDLNAVHRIVHFEMPGGFKTWAAVQDGGDQLVFAAIIRQSHHEYMNVYTLPLSDPLITLEHKNLIPPTLLHTIKKQPDHGIFSDLHVHTHIVAAKLFKMTGPFPGLPRTSLLLINTRTGAKLIAQMSILLLTNVQIRVFDGHIAVIGVKADMALIVRIYRLPREITATSAATITTTAHDMDILQIDDLGPPILAFDPIPILSRSEYHISDDVSRIGGLMVLCIDPSLDPPRHSGEFVARYPINLSHLLSRSTTTTTTTTTTTATRSPTTTARKHPISTSPQTLPEIVCVGNSGHRAVWLERSWETDEFRVMKLGYFPNYDLNEGEKPVIVGPLFPAYMALPFRPETCQSLAFDDAAGRLCLGLHSGEIYVLDFV